MMKKVNWILAVTLFFVASACGDDTPPVGVGPSDPCDGANPPPSCQFEQNNDTPDMTESEPDMGTPEVDLGSDMEDMEDMEPECVPETEICDGEDNDCDGDIDEGFALGEVCEEGEGACLNTGETICNDAGDDVTCSATAGDPSAEEICDGSDNDCDGEIDEGFDTLGDACTSGVGACEVAGNLVCTDDGMGVKCDAMAGTPAAMDLCDGIDNDCNGTIDDDFATDLGTACSVGVGACVNTGMNVCADDQMSVVCDVIPLNPPEANEVTCDGVDNDCDGTVDEGCDDDNDDYCDDNFTTVGTPAVCPNGGGDCNDTEDTAFPGGTEVCDGLDNDCNGTRDDSANDANTYYVDCDGDGFAATAGGSRTQCAAPSDGAATTSCGGAANASWTTTLPSNSTNTDCQDAEPNAYPGQTMFFETSYTATDGSTSYDYNCDNVFSRPTTNTGVSTSEPCNSTTCTFLAPNCGASGWSSSVAPSCGNTGTYSSCGSSTTFGCSLNEKRCLGGSRTVESNKPQVCR